MKFVLKNSKYLSLLLVASLVVMGLLTRFYRFGQIPTGTYWDETSMLAEARSIADRGLDTHGNHWLQPIFPAYGDYKLPVYIWLTSLTVKMFGASAVAVRLPSAIAGMATILVAIALAHRLLKKKQLDLILATSVFLVFLLSPWSIQFSRTGFEGHVGQLLLGLAAYLAMSKSKLKRLVLSQMVAAAATYTYFSVRYVWPVLFVVIAIVFVFDDVIKAYDNLVKVSANRLKFVVFLCKKGIIIGVSLALFFLLLLPMYRADLYSDMQRFRFGTDSIFNMEDWALKSNRLREKSGNSIVSRAFYHRHWLMIRELLKNFSDHLSLNYIFVGGDSNLRHGTGRHGLFLLPFSVLLFIGLFLLAKKRFRLLIILLIWWIVALLPASVPETTPHALRSLNGIIPLGLMISFGGYYLINFCKEHSRRLQLVFIFLIWILFSFGAYSYHYIFLYPSISANAWQTGLISASKQVCQVRNEYQKVIIDINDNLFNQWIMANCSFTREIWDQATFQNYKLQKIDNIVFSQANPSLTINDYLLVTDEPRYAKDNTSLELISTLAYPKKTSTDYINFYQTHGQQ